MKQKLAAGLGVALALAAVAGGGMFFALENAGDATVTDSKVIEESDGSYTALIEVTTTREPGHYAPDDAEPDEHSQWVGFGAYDSEHKAQQAIDDYDPNDREIGTTTRVLIVQFPFSAAGAAVLLGYSRREKE